MGLRGGPAHAFPYSPRLWLKGDCAGADRELGNQVDLGVAQGLPGSEQQAGRKRGWSGNSGGGARAGAVMAELGEETVPRSSAGSSPLLRTQAPGSFP